MGPRNLTPAEKALIEREFVYKQNWLIARRRNGTRIFVIGLLFAFVSAVCTYLGTLFWISFITRLLWLLTIAAFLIYLGAPLPYSQGVGSGSGLNPWKDSLSELKEPIQVVQAAVLLSSFVAFRLLIGAFLASLK
jgi:hypothetical protein